MARPCGGRRKRWMDLAQPCDAQHFSGTNQPPEEVRFRPAPAVEAKRNEPVAAVDGCVTQVKMYSYRQKIQRLRCSTLFEVIMTT